MSPYAALAAVALLAASHGATAWWMYGAGKDSVIADQAHDAETAREAREAALQTVAQALAAQETRNVTITQRLEQQVREVPVYRDCVLPAAGLRDLNAAITGRDESAGAGDMHTADPASGAR